MFVGEYNIVCLTETFCLSSDHEDPLCDQHSIDGFTLIHKPRRKCRRASGGLCLAIKNDLLKYITYVENECNFILWCKIDKRCFDTYDHIYLACVYVPPETSNYVTVSCFDEIESEIIECKKLSDLIIVGGDFNAHTSTRPDIISIDPLDAHIDHILPDLSAIVSIETKLELLQLPCTRLTEDTHGMNNWGHKLIECCHNTGMCIVNGRYGINSSHCTTTNNTIIDYFLCTAETFQFIKDMTVHTFNPCLSDVHVPIDITLKLYDTTHNVECHDDNDNARNENMPNMQENKCKVGPWDQSKNNEFIDNFDTDLLQQIDACIDNFNENGDKQAQLDIIMGKFECLLTNAGIETFGRKRMSRNNNRNIKSEKTKTKPYYTLICRNKKVIFNQARKKYQNSRTDDTATRNMNIAGKLYKKEVKTAHTAYRTKIRKEVRNLRNLGNIQKYWDYIKKDTSSNGKSDIDFQKFVDFFKNINTTQMDDQYYNTMPNENEHNNELDVPITETEILEAANKLKTRKAVGGDGISNEQIKASVNTLKSTLSKIFNIVFNKGVIPTIWTQGIIKPIYKKKGAKNNPDNYRPITIISCMGKLFTSILNIRLTKYLEKRETIGEEQLGFRKNYSTIDGAFILNSLLEMMTNNNKSLYCAFIDLKKCFGSIWRNGMFFKLCSYDLGYKMMNVLKALYANVKSCVEMNFINANGNMSYNISEVFPCSNGLREGDILSPILFSIYVNDLKSFLEENFCHGIDMLYTNDNDVMCYLQMLLLMYADDTVLFASSKRQLQHSLNMYEKYCKKWKLNVNANKTKIVIFGRKKNHTFTLDNQQIEVVNSFKYLGIIFKRNGSFIEAIKDNIQKATLAMYSLRRTFKEKLIPIDCQIDIFEKTIEPILLYGAEIWGFSNTKIIEKFYLKTLKQILGLRKSTPTYMIYGEIGKYPIIAKIKMRMIKYVIKLTKGNGNKLSEIFLKTMTKDNVNTYKWLEGIKKILRDTGYPFLTTQIHNIHLHTADIKQTLIDQALQDLNTDSSKCTYYKYIKDKPGMAYYLTCLPHKHTLSLMKFRTANHRLPIEIGRHTNTIRAARICPFCPSLGDEYHYVMYCPKFNTPRQRYIHTQYTNRPNMYKYHALMNTDDINQLQKLAVFISIITNAFK